MEWIIKGHECLLILRTALAQVAKQATSPRTLTTRVVRSLHAQDSPHELAKTILLPL